MYYRGSQGIMIVFDVTDETTFKSIPYWLKNLQEHAPENVYVVLVGNKIDLVAERVITKERAEEFARENSLKYFETSAKENIGVDEAFQSLAEDVWCKMLDRESVRNIIEGVPLAPAKKQKGCACEK
jgi:small GTP-binding protein